MKQNFIIVVLSLLIGFLAYLILSDLLVSIIIVIAFLLVLFLIMKPFLKRALNNERKELEAGHFIQNFFSSLAATSSIEEAYQSASLGAEGEFLDYLKSISNDEVDERLRRLNLYFQSDDYEMFLSLLTLYKEQGGNVIELSSPLLETIAHHETTRKKEKEIRKKNNYQFLSLWGLSVVILLFVRFGLSNFDDLVSNSLLYTIIGSLYFFFALLSFYLYMRHAYPLGEKKGEPTNEKLLKAPKNE